MIVLFTDFGNSGPYVGQMRAVLEQQAPGVSIVELFNDAPRFNPVASSYLLAAYTAEFPAGTVFLCVVDPGVGSQQRKPMMHEVDGRWFVGPGNGLFDVILARGKEIKSWEITWLPETLSNTFHGRDLFAPVAASLARGDASTGVRIDNPKPEKGSSDWPHVIYIDSFGNVMTGLRACFLDSGVKLRAGNQVLEHANTFADVPVGQAFWYGNANGLVEFAVNQGRACEVLAIKLGDEVTVLRD